MTSGQQLTLERLRRPLERERDQLREAREAILQQLKVLKAEQVTIQRLIQAHVSGEPEEPPRLSSLPPANSTLGGGEDSEPMDHTLFHLPELNLEVEPFMLGLGAEEPTEEDDFD